MKKVAIALITVFIMLGCGKVREEDSENYQVRNGLGYIIGEEKPYTGKIFIKGEERVGYRTIEYKQQVLELKNGLLDGTNIFYSSNGKVLSKTKVKNNMANGIKKTYHRNGKIATESYYIDGKMEGITKVYYPDGKIRCKMKMENNKITGIANTYYENGKLEKEENFVNSNLDGVSKYYNENGKLSHEIIWGNGKEIEKNYY